MLIIYSWEFNSICPKLTSKLGYDTRSFSIVNSVKKVVILVDEVGADIIACLSQD